MKVFARSFNGVLNRVIETLKSRNEYTDNYHDADIFLLWQDIRGACKEIAEIGTESLKKPVVVVQHGRGATRDYCHPNKFPLIADKICVWGEADRQRLITTGINSDKIIITGCPLLAELKPKVKRDYINLLYVPVISSKEEPENIQIFSLLKIWESKRLFNNITSNFSQFKRGWAYETKDIRKYKLPDGKEEDRLFKREVITKLPRSITYGFGLVNTKVTSVHDLHQYMGAVILSDQGSPNHIKDLVELLRHIDIMVCLEEGTMQLLACALDIPIVHVDIFNYDNYGGCANYDEVEKIATNACYRTRNLGKLESLIDHALTNPAELRAHRIKVVEDEGGVNLGDANENIIKVVESYRPIKERILVAA